MRLYALDLNQRLSVKKQGLSTEWTCLYFYERIHY